MSDQPPPPPPPPSPPTPLPRRPSPSVTQPKPTSRKRPYKPKVKTGCTSCRIRRVKCDEGKPSCQRCITTGRTCDGYEDLFRIVQWAPDQSGSPEPEEAPARPPPVQRSKKQSHRSLVREPPAVTSPTGPDPASAVPARASQLQVGPGTGQTTQPGPPEPFATPSSTSPSPSSSSSWPTAVGLAPVTVRQDVFPQPIKSRSAAVPSQETRGLAAPAYSVTSATCKPTSLAVAPQLPYRETALSRPTAVNAPQSEQLQPGQRPRSLPPPPSISRTSPSAHSPYPSTPLTTQDITALAARFTNKPVPHGYEHEARTTLEASQSEPAVRHALASLSSLYRTLEDHGHEFPHGRLAVPTVYHGLQEYHNAIVNLSNKLSVMDRRSCEVALVCCRLFISIETMQRDYVSVADHYVRGMRIMHEAATRPYLDARGNVIPTQNGDFPKIDNFMIKLFMSPDKLSPACKDAIAGRPPRGGGGVGAGRRRRRAQRSMRILRLARIEVRAARVKARLLVISELALQHFDNVSRLRPGSDASRVVAEREVLLGMLEDLDLRGRDGERDLGPYHGRFHFLYHCALKIAVSLSLWAPTEDLRGLQPVFDLVDEVSGSVL